MAKKPKVGDRVWLKIPHNGTIDRIYADGAVSVLLDSIGERTSMGRFMFGKNEVQEDEIRVIPKAHCKKSL